MWIVIPDGCKTVMKRPCDVYQVMVTIFMQNDALERAREHFWVMGLGDFNEVLFLALVALGGENRVVVEQSYLYRVVLHKGAGRIVLVHNHPRGYLLPSDADIAFTRQALDSGRLLGIEVVDHFIISETGYFNFASNLKTTGGIPLYGLNWSPEMAKSLANK